MREFKIEVPEGCKPVNVQVDGRFITYGVEGIKKFNDGDILLEEDGSIVIYNPNYKTFYDGVGYYCAIHKRLHIHKDGETAPFGTFDEVLRFATEDEKQKLFDALAKEGKQWNAEKKQIESIRWRAKAGDRYWYFDTEIQTDNCSDEYDSVDGGRYDIGNYFKTEQEAEAMAEKFRNLLKQ